MKTLLVYAKNYGKFPKNFIHNILWGCFYESCVAFHRNYTDRKQYIFREKETCAPSRSRFFSGKRNCEQTDLSHWHSITNPWKFEVGVKGYAGKRCSVAGEASF